MVFKLFAKFNVPNILQFQSSSPPKKNNLVATLYPTLSSDATSRGAAARHSMISNSSSEDMMNSWSSTPDESSIPTDIKEVIPLTTICAEQEINRATYKILQQCIDLLKSLPDDRAFVFESKYVPSSTIGKHVRHMYDHFRSLFGSKPVSTKRSFADEYFNASDDNDNESVETLDVSSDWNVDYDSRIRGGAIETSRMTAIQQIERLQLTVLDYSTSISLNTPINISTTAVDKDSMHLQSTFGRELWFCCHHAIHHYALIRVICIELKIPYPEDFGIAPSTLLEDKNQNNI